MKRTKPNIYGKRIASREMSYFKSEKYFEQKNIDQQKNTIILSHFYNQKTENTEEQRNCQVCNIM